MFGFCKRFCKSRNGAEEDVLVPQPPESMFFLSETMAEYHRQVAAIKKNNSNIIRHFKTLSAEQVARAAALRQEANDVKLGDGQPAQEQRRLEKSRLLKEAEKAQDTANLYMRNWRWGEENEGVFALYLSEYWYQDRCVHYSKKITSRAIELARGWEYELLAREGEVLLQTFEEKGAIRRIERRVVRYCGRVFLIRMIHCAVTRLERRTGPYGLYDQTDTILIEVPTGEWKQPVADWATESVAQMSEEEFRAIA